MPNLIRSRVWHCIKSAGLKSPVTITFANPDAVHTLWSRNTGEHQIRLTIAIHIGSDKAIGSHDRLRYNTVQSKGTIPTTQKHLNITQFTVDKVGDSVLICIGDLHPVTWRQTVVIPPGKK